MGSQSQSQRSGGEECPRVRGGGQAVCGCRGQSQRSGSEECLELGEECLGVAA